MVRRIVITCLLCICLAVVPSCGSGLSTGGQSAQETAQTISAQLHYTHSMQTDYAEGFAVDYYAEDFALITLSDGSRFLIAPEPAADGTEAAVPGDLPKDIVVLRRPVDNIYLAASAVMDMFCAMGALDCITLSGIEQNAWHIAEAYDAMARGDILYAGKYSAPDYELIKAKGCTLTVQSTMLEHVPEVKEQLELLGIHVFEDHSSYEESPLGRMEWIKVYGVLTGHEEAAQAVYETQREAFAKGTATEQLQKRVAFFHVTTTGAVTIRKPEDYIAKMIGLAGGTYAFADMEVPEGATGTMNIQMEQFYASAKDADVLIYNSTIAGEIYSVDELLEISPLFAEFKAVREGNVWCISADFFQNSMQLGTAQEDLHRLLAADLTQISGTESEEGFTFLYRLE